MEDDPVVKEVDVYLTKQLKDSLYVFQYPVRSSLMTYDNADYLGARVKPKQHKVELDLNIDTDTPNYDKSKGDEIAQSINGPSAASVHTGSAMNKIILTSSCSACDISRYVVAAYKDGGLHLTPLEAIVQLRPSFRYLDTADVKAELLKAQQAAEKAATNAESSQDEDEFRPLLARFARNETDEMRARKVASYDYHRRLNEEEEWIKLYPHQIGDIRSENEKELLYYKDDAQVPADISTQFRMTNEEYLQKLVSKVDSDESTAPQSTNATAQQPPNPATQLSINASLSLRRIRQMPVSDQIRTILTNVKIINFSRLMGLISQRVEATDVLLCIQQCAVLVQGCWVVKSLLLYSKETFSLYNGKLSGEVLANVRDYVLWRLAMGRSLTRKDITDVACIPKEDEQTILEQVAVCAGREGWKLKLDRDIEFESDYPEVVLRQNQYWVARIQSLSLVLPIHEHLDGIPLVASSNPYPGIKKLSTVGKQKQTAPSASTANENAAIELPSDDDSMDVLITDETMAAAGKSAADDEGMLDMGNLSEVINMEDVSNSASAQNVTRMGMSSGTYEQPHISPELKRAIIEFAREKLLTKYVLSVGDLKEMFTIRLAELPPGNILGSGVSDYLLEFALNEAGGVKLNAVNCRRETLYAFRRANDRFDPIRAAIIEQVNIKPGLRITVLRKKLEHCGPFSDEDLKRILKDYCLTSGGSWHLKGTKADLG